MLFGHHTDLVFTISDMVEIEDFAELIHSWSSIFLHFTAQIESFKKISLFSYSLTNDHYYAFASQI